MSDGETPVERPSSSREAGRKEASLGSSKSERSEHVVVHTQNARRPPVSLFRESLEDGILWLRCGERGLFLEVSQPLRDRRTGAVRWVNARLFEADLPALERMIARMRDERGDGVVFRSPDREASASGAESPPSVGVNVSSPSGCPRTVVSAASESGAEWS